MACMEKLSLRGIRSFSPSRDEIIEFYSPLTMIVGANGCGKTTIIESLKYVCTGSLPPNSHSGQTFVNDPSVSDVAEVKANIKLRFRNKAGNPCVVTRSLQLTKKKARLEFKAMDGVIRTTNASNEKVSSSQKCSDLDKLIPEMLAVSAAILDNVIFCHQEDSSWPMQEGLALKKKFDDIFESTRYAQALDAFRKAKTEFASRAKDLKGEVAELGAHLAAANECKKELRVCEENQSGCQEELDGLETKIASVESKLRCCEDSMRVSKQASDDLKELEWRAQESERRVSDKRASIDEIRTETDEELKTMLINFDEQMLHRRREHQSLQQGIDRLRQEISELRTKSDDLNLKKGMAESLRDYQASAQVDLYKLLISLSRKYSLAQQIDNHGDASAAVGSGRQILANLDRHLQAEQARVEGAIRTSRESLQAHEKRYTDEWEEQRRCELDFASKVGRKPH